MKRTHGFTLIELLVVLAIIGMLAALVGPALFSNLGKGQRTSAASQIDSLGSALDLYRLDMNRFPQTLQGLVENDTGSSAWTGPYLRGGLPQDPWDNDYVYETDGRTTYSLISYGADGAPGGEGDDADIGGE